MGRLLHPLTEDIILSLVVQTAQGRYVHFLTPYIEKGGFANATKKNLKPGKILKGDLKEYC